MSGRGNVKIIRNAGLILSILIYSAIRFVIINKSQILGASYFFSSFDFILLFIMGGGYCILDVVSKHCKAHMDLDCFKNAKRVVIYGAILAFAYSVIIGGAVVVLQDGICEGLLAGKNCRLTLLYLLPMFSFVCISAAFKGFFIGARLHKQAYLGMALELAVTCLMVVICSTIFSGTGSKVANLFADYKVLNAYISAGAALGLSIGAGIGLVIDIIMFSITSKKLVLIDETRRMVDVYDLSIQMISEMLFLGVAMFIPLLSVFILQTLMIRNISVSSVDIYSVGCFFGVFGTLASMIVLFTYVYSFFDKRSLSIAYIDNNRQELRSKVNNMIKLFFTYSIPTVLVVIVLADVICKMIGADSAMAVVVIRISSVAIVFYAFGIMFMNILVAVNKTISAIVNGIIALVLSGVFNSYLLGKLGLGVYGLVIGFYAFSVIYAVLIFLSASSSLKCRLKLVASMVGPAIVGIITSLVCLVLKLILGLFAPAVVILVVSLLISMIVMFIAYIKLGITDYHHVCKSPISFILVPIGQIFGLFKR